MDDWVERVAAALVDGEVELTTYVGGAREVTHARLWRGQLLVDWQTDEQAGGCLVRPNLLERLVLLGAVVHAAATQVELRASGRVLAALSNAHAELVEALGGIGRVELRATLRFDGERYRGGEEVYVVTGGRRAEPILRLTATIRSGSPRTLPATR